MLECLKSKAFYICLDLHIFLAVVIFFLKMTWLILKCGHDNS